MSDNIPETPEHPVPLAARIRRALQAGWLWVLESGPDYALPAIGVVLLAVMTSVVMQHEMPGTLGSNTLVTFDVIKLGNAERAVASGLLGSSANSGDDALLLTEASKRVTSVIAQEAHGRLVIIRQALVDSGSSVPDITDAVLKDLGLPTDVPTVDNQRVISDQTYVTSGLQQSARDIATTRAHNSASAQVYWRNRANDSTQRLVP